MTQDPSENAPQSEIVIRVFPVGPLQCNCTILGDPVSKEAIVIDPGGDAEKILKTVEDMGCRVSRILHTHAHFDHFLASGQMKAATEAPLALHREDKFLWDILEQQCGMFGIPYRPVPPPDQWLEDEETIGLPHLHGTALHTPGHTPGSMSFSFPDQQFLVAGDTLFKGGIGRTDLWGGDFPTIERSIRHKLYTLDEATRVVTGHGPSTTIGQEVRSNPYVTA